MPVIVGAVSKTGQRSVTDTVTCMMKAVTKDAPHLDKAEIYLQNECFEFSPIGKSEIVLPSSTIGLGVAYSSSHESSCLAVGEPESRIAVLSGRVFNYDNAPDILLTLLKKYIDKTGNIEIASRNLVETLDGQYALVLRWEDAVLLARDPVGVKPLYLAADDQIVVFSSRLKPISNLGMNSCSSVVQPTLIARGVTRPIGSARRVKSIRLADTGVVDSLAGLLSKVLSKMIHRQRRIGLLFSGGLDSSILAKLSKDLGVECLLYCAGTSSSRDMVNAKRMSVALDMKLVQKEISYEEIAQHVSTVVRIVESTDMIRVSTSLPIYFAVMESAKEGEEVMLHGQGADELYGGYERYEKTLVREGYASARSEMLKDVKNLANIMPQYDQIGGSASVEMLAPFLDTSVVRFSLGIPIQLKLHQDGLRVTRKFVLHKVASRIGIPTGVLPKEKVAVQFGSGVARIMDMIARREGFSSRVAKASGFALPVQAYLKRIGQSAGLLPERD
jgi:asparagine synthase (glutamine-hydrolysing)